MIAILHSSHAEPCYLYHCQLAKIIAFATMMMMKGLDQGHLHPLHRASNTEASQSGIEPGTSCTAGEHSIQRAIRTTLLTDLGLYY
jgi:hypothetical protein